MAARPRLTRLSVPAGLAWWRRVPGGAAWLERLPELAAGCAERWQLRLAPPFEPASISLVVPAELPDGTPAVLKLSFPDDPESEHEADALVLWDGRAAARLLARDDTCRALLVERCLPGRPLWELPEEQAFPLAADVLGELWQPPPAGHAYALLAHRAARWAAQLPGRWERSGRPCGRSTVERVVGWLHELPASQPSLVVCHQDLHGGNILSAERAPWLAIDPKPLAGEPAFDCASLLRDRRSELLAGPRPERRLAWRLALLSERLELEPERLRGWAAAHALAWGIEEDGTLHPAELAVADLLAMMRM